MFTNQQQIYIYKPATSLCLQTSNMFMFTNQQYVYVYKPAITLCLQIILKVSFENCLYKRIWLAECLNYNTNLLVIETCSTVKVGLLLKG